MVIDVERAMASLLPPIFNQFVLAQTSYTVSQSLDFWISNRGGQRGGCYAGGEILVRTHSR
jgi:hypothetical protein